MSTAQKIGVLIFSLVFLLIGALMVLGFTIRPLVQERRTNTWIATPCTVLTSVIRTDRRSQNHTYEAEVRYQYVFHGKSYISSIHNPNSNYSSDLRAKQAIVAQYPTGEASICYVDPNNPANAVLNRERPSDIWLGVFGLPFVLVGAGFLGYVAVQTIKPFWRSVEREKEQTPGIKLRPVKSERASVVVLAIFWNLFMAVAIYLVARQWSARPNYIAAAIVLVFGLIGLLLLYSVLSRILVVFNPKIVMKVFGYRLGPGERFDLSWTISRPSHFFGVEIWLRTGVHAVPVYVAPDENIQANGQVSVKIPEDKPTNDPIVIEFIGHVKRFSNVHKKYVVTL